MSLFLTVVACWIKAAEKKQETSVKGETGHEHGDETTEITQMLETCSG